MTSQPQDEKPMARMLRCPLCAEAQEIRTSKTGKPYIVCDDCGVQLFVRGSRGQRRLEALLSLGTDDRKENKK